MQILSLRTLRLFWEQHPQSETPLKAWYSRVKAAQWTTPGDAKADFGTLVDFVADNRIIFDVGGNKYRVVVHVSYKFQRVLVKFVGTHKDFDAIKAESV